MFLPFSASAAVAIRAAIDVAFEAGKRADPSESANDVLDEHLEVLVKIAYDAINGIAKCDPPSQLELAVMEAQAKDVLVEVLEPDE